MDFTNSTPFSAGAIRAVLPYRDLMLATIVAKCSFEVSPTGEVSVAVEQTAFEEADTVTAYGFIDGDMVPIKQGCDFAVLGSAYALPPGRVVTEHDVRLRVGDFQRHWRVYGDRRWRKTEHGFEATPAEPFAEMVLGYDKAYGGTATWERGKRVACAENPTGRGFVLREEDVEGLALPNLEDIGHLIQSWQDRPVPAGLGPLSRGSSLRGARGYRVDNSTRTGVVEPLAFCFAHPAMILPVYPSGAPFELVGMGLGGSMSFTVPAIELRVRLQLGAHAYELALVPDTFCVFPDERRFQVVARRALVYQFIAERIRKLTVEAGAATETMSPLTIRTARDDQSLGVKIAPDDDNTLHFFDELLRRNPMTEIVESLPLFPSA